MDDFGDFIVTVIMAIVVIALVALVGRLIYEEGKIDAFAEHCEDKDNVILHGHNQLICVERNTLEL